MFHLVKITNLIIKRTPLLCGLLIAAVIALLPFSAAAQCATKWYAPANLKIMQRGQALPIVLKIAQKGAVLSGTADLHMFSEGKKIHGTVDGAIQGNTFNIQIFWNNWQIGVYEAKILPSGRLDGVGWEKNSPNVKVTFYSEEMLKCPPPPAFGAGGLFGMPAPKKAPKPATKPSAPPPTPPFIIAGQPYLPPYMPYGIVGMSWDGGPDHPKAEVFLSMDNGAETPAFSIDQPQQSPLWKQPKAGLSMHLQRYHHYRFVLKAEGKTLSTAVFVVP